MITIALAEDNVLTLKRFADYFKVYQDYKIVIEAYNGHDLILKINLLKHLPDIILTDINMPVIDGTAVAYYLKLHFPSIKVIGLSNYSDETSVKNIILSGADGFVMKALAENVLEDAIRVVLLNKIYIDKRIEVDQQQINKALNKRKERFLKENLFDLTKRERTFLMLNATLLSYDQIAEAMFIETKTVQSYYDQISKKLNLHNRQALTLFSLQNGLASIAYY
jgi:DNA-binding NarL/FixJ family response regulator